MVTTRAWRPFDSLFVFFIVIGSTCCTSVCSLERWCCGQSARGRLIIQAKKGPTSASRCLRVDIIQTHARQALNKHVSIRAAQHADEEKTLWLLQPMPPFRVACVKEAHEKDFQHRISGCQWWIKYFQVVCVSLGQNWTFYNFLVFSFFKLLINILHSKHSAIVVLM